MSGAGLPRCAGSSLDPAGWLPIAAPSPAAKHRLRAPGLQQLRLPGPRAQAQASQRTGEWECVFPDQGWSPVSRTDRQVRCPRSHQEAAALASAGQEVDGLEGHIHRFPPGVSFRLPSRPSGSSHTASGCSLGRFLSMPCFSSGGAGVGGLS